MASLASNQPQAFIEALFSEKPSDLYVLLWTLPEKESHWFRDVPAAIRCAEELRARNLYVGVGLAKHDCGPNRRCPSEEIVGIPGLWADIDIRSDAHPKATLPSNIEQALSMLPPEFPPSIIVLTGNGVHAWWLFREPWVFESEVERHEAAALAIRWNNLLRDNANQRGWTYERLADLARVLRVPGTTNCKDPVNPRPVVVHSQTDRRFNPSEFVDFLDELGVAAEDAEGSFGREWAERLKNTPLTIDLGARIPEDLLNTWRQEDDRFRDTWFRQRSDLKDQSQSGYDLALSNFGFRRGISEQRIVDLIIHHRAAHRQKPRTRLDYFLRTFSKTAEAVRGNNISEARPDPHGSDPADRTSRPTGGTSAETSAQSKSCLCRQLSSVFEIEILRIVKISGSEPFYRMDTAAGRIDFSDVGKLLSQAAVRNAIAGAAGKLIPRFKPKQWEEIAQVMLNACIVEEGSEELFQDGAARMYLRQYLAEAALITSPEDQTALDLRMPMVRDGRITVCASDLRMHINKTTQENFSVKAVAGMLAAIGAKTLRVRGKRIKEQSRWELPPDEFDPDDYVQGSGSEVPAHG